MTLRTTTFSATRWTTASVMFGAGLQLVQTIILARLLTPADFGLMALAGVATAVVALFADFGISSALMYFPRPQQHVLSTLYWFNFGLACVLAVAFVLLAWPIAHVLKQPALLPLLWWLSLRLPLGAVGQPFRVLAEKELRFTLLAQNEIAAAALGFFVALAVAFVDGGVFALITAALMSSACSSIMAWIRLSDGSKPHATFDIALAKPFIGFGLHRVGENLWNTLWRQTDVFIAGLFAPPAAVAAYSVPREQCLRVANTIVNPVVTRVGLPVMTRLQGDLPALRSVYLQMLRMTASLNFPIYALMVLFPQEIITLLLGNQWYDSTFYLRLLGVWGLIRSTINPFGSLLYAVGMARRAHVWNLIWFIVTALVLWSVTWRWGLHGLTWAMLVLCVIMFVLVWRFLIRPACGAGFLEYNVPLLPPLAATALASVMAFAVVHEFPAFWHLPVGVVVFGCTYLASSWWINRPWVTAMIELLAPLRRLLRRTV